MGRERRVNVEVDFTDDEFLKLAIMAHEQDITINQLINDVLQDEMDRQTKLAEEQ